MHSMHLHICTDASNHVSCDIGCLGCPRNAEMRWEMISMALSCSKGSDRPVLRLSALGKFNLWGSFRGLWVARKTRALVHFHPWLYTTSPQPKWPCVFVCELSTRPEMSGTEHRSPATTPFWSWGGLIILHHCPLSLDEFSKSFWTSFWTWYSQHSLSISEMGWPAGRNLRAVPTEPILLSVPFVPSLLRRECERTVEMCTYLDLTFVLYYKDINLSMECFTFQILVSFVFRANGNWFGTSNKAQVERNFNFFLPN